MRRPGNIFWLMLAAAAAMPVEAARALTPDEVVVLFNPRSANSQRVARFYMTARRIPQDHLLPIISETLDTVPEEFYRTSIVPQLRKLLNERKLDPKCVVTTFDMPLRVGPRQPTLLEKQELAALEKQFQETLAALEGQVAAYEQILPVAASTAPATNASAPATAPAPNAQNVTQRLNAAASAAASRLQNAPASSRAAALQQFVAAHERVAGLTGVLSILQVPEGPGADEGRRRLNAMAETRRGFEERAVRAEKMLDTAPGRKEYVEARAKTHGLVGQAQAIEQAAAYIKPDNTESSFDNELALALSTQGYPRLNWIINPLNVENHATIQRLNITSIPKTLMVCRLDGLTPQAVEEMILTGLKVETTGLEGKLYFDARGIRSNDGYGIFDADLRAAAEWTKAHASIETILDDRPELLRAANAPDAALYCGWYSLRNYQDSAQWVKGAVGYHVASFEMMTLHDPKETGWVTNLLSRGFCGTLGPTDEPYLTSFPKPSQFFPLLLSGEFTQGEVWQLTSPMLSWRTAFVGDPLYNPFRVKPRVKVEDLKAHPVLRNAFAILRGEAGATTGPATMPR